MRYVQYHIIHASDERPHNLSHEVRDLAGATLGWSIWWGLVLAFFMWVV